MQAVEQELQRRQAALQALEPSMDVDGEAGIPEENPALLVGSSPPRMVQASLIKPSGMLQSAKPHYRYRTPVVKGSCRQ